MRLIAVGRLRAGAEAALFERYARRLRLSLAVTEIPEATGSAVELKRREAAAMRAALGAAEFAVALDLGARAPTSEQLAALLAAWANASQKPCFLIGGAEGLDATILARANHTISLGPLTWPHMLVRVMLAEQLYRAQAINAGHPYHRAGRP